MFIWRGTANGEAFSNAKNLPTQIRNFVLVNVSGGAVNVYGYINRGASDYPIMEYPKTLSAGEKYTSDLKIGMEEDDRVKLVTNGNCSYYFTFENSNPDGDTNSLT